MSKKEVCMKNVKIKIALAAIALGSVITTANAADGSIHFTGEILATACNVTNGVNKIINVDLGKVSAASLKTAGTRSSSVPFDIKLDQCPLQTANVRFDGTADATDKNLLAIDATSVAKGVGIEIDSATGKQIPLYTPSDDIALTAGTNTLHYMARYVSTAATVTAGTVNATSQFTIIYK